VAERKRRPAADGNGGIGGLTGGGPSIVGVSGAMRARDVSRPRAKDAERAERSVVIRRVKPEVRPALDEPRTPPRTP
jgi:hypothetical protein